MSAIELRPGKVKDLIESFQSGKILVPEFQRSYVWKGAKWAKLLDSLFRKYPVGSLLVWESEDIVKTRSKIKPKNVSSKTSWLIDGQQRLTTLSKIFNADEGIDIMFNPHTTSFRQTNAALRKDGKWYRVAEIWDDNEYRKLRSGFDHSETAYLEKQCDSVREILSYEVPIVKMIDHNFEEAVDAFQRINTLGVKLKSEDIESAKVASKHSGFLRDEILPFLKDLRDSGFNRLSIIHLFRVCSALAKPDGRSRILLHEISEREMQKAWKCAKKGIEKTLDILRSELMITDMKILWSGSFLVPPFIICANTPAKELDSREIVGWIALAALHHRYSGSSGTMLDKDVKVCLKSNPIGSLIKNLKDQKGLLEADPRDFQGSILDRSAILAAYIVCKYLGARDLFSGEYVDAGKNIERHHLIPRACFKKDERNRADTIANIAWIGSITNRTIQDKLDYLKDIDIKILKSQGIDPDLKDITIQDADIFWQSRRKNLSDGFNAFLNGYMPNRRFGRV